jgi:hypothetical protein
MDLTYFKCDYEPCGKVTQGDSLEDGWIEIRGGKGNTITFVRKNDNKLGYLYVEGTNMLTLQEKEPVVHFCCFNCMRDWFESLRPLIELGKKE